LSEASKKGLNSGEYTSVESVLFSCVRNKNCCSWSPRVCLLRLENYWQNFLKWNW
jgi:hypothetical protein